MGLRSLRRLERKKGRYWCLWKWCRIFLPTDVEMTQKRMDGFEKLSYSSNGDLSW